jgi:RNA polymerase primary sigma factor
MRFGFINDTIYTLEEVGSAIGVSRERVRQIETSILEKLRQDEGLKKLSDFLD